MDIYSRTFTPPVVTKASELDYKPEILAVNLFMSHISEGFFSITVLKKKKKDIKPWRQTMTSSTLKIFEPH